jgi:hypothetical protein
VCTSDYRTAEVRDAKEIGLWSTYRWPLGEEPDEALMPLCRRHHLALHQLRTKRPHRELERLTLGNARWGRFRRG